jgi:hypothetical protein
VKAINFLFLVTSLMVVASLAEAKVLNYNNRQVFFEDRLDGCGGSADLRFEVSDVVLTLKTMRCPYSTVDYSFRSTRSVYHLSLNATHFVEVTTGLGAGPRDTIEVNTVISRIPRGQ